MALTPEDVVNKRFQATKFREGYDQDEVDDFLDEIVVEMRRLYEENDQLRRKVAELQGGNVDAVQVDVPAPVSASGEEAAPAPATEPEEPAADEVVEEEVVAVEEEVTSEPAAEQVEEPAAPAAAAAPAAGVAPAAAVAYTESAESAAGVLTMAQRLHDEYVADGKATRDRIISEAQQEADKLVSDAQETSRRTLNEFEQKKSVLEREVEELRGFERDYRSRLRAYIEGQLQDLDAQSNISE